MSEPEEPLDAPQQKSTAASQWSFLVQCIGVTPCKSAHRLAPLTARARVCPGSPPGTPQTCRPYNTMVCTILPVGYPQQVHATDATEWLAHDRPPHHR
jgi:hypothetical protein